MGNIWLGGSPTIVADYRSQFSYCLKLSMDAIMFTSISWVKYDVTCYIITTVIPIWVRTFILRISLYPKRFWEIIDALTWRVIWATVLLARLQKASKFILRIHKRRSLSLVYTSRGLTFLNLWKVHRLHSKGMRIWSPFLASWKSSTLRSFVFQTPFNLSSPSRPLRPHSHLFLFASLGDKEASFWHSSKNWAQNSLGPITSPETLDTTAGPSRTFWVWI